ncbi:unnamed protein product [Mytilus coruscus]|uniref:Ig-like domain-containing protein n=1 Tax=Mytilus coruscus TaxID=42192 RepID=A0A6J8B665_MYTCO|nr:unnamed protein product [Mytilus coruscus]
MAMMEHFQSSILVGLLISATFAIKLTLQGPKYTRRNDIISINCSTDTPSVGLEAEILINSKTYTNMRTHKNKCFSALQGLDCAKDVCQCSKRGYWFSHKYNVNVDNVENDILIITCVMKYGADGGNKVSESISIKIIDFLDPTLTVGSPLVTGTIARATCQVLTNLKDVSLLWNCGNSGRENTTRTSHTYISVLTFKVKPFHQNANCTCTGRFEEFQVSSTIQLDVDNKPILNSTKNAICNISSSVQMSCTLYSEMSSFGFNSWTHLFNGIAVRVLHGVTYGNMSILNISFCSYQDAGIYLCSAWHKFNDKAYHSNSSTTLTFNGPPIILSAKIVRENVVTITVNFYSTSDIQRPVWFSMLEPIFDTTGFNTTIENTTVSLPVHNQSITCKGYVSNLSMGTYRNMKYTVLLKNEFGDTRKTFELHSAPESLEDDHVYERTNHQYLELMGIPQESHYSDIKEEEDELQLSGNDDRDDYEEID